MNEQKAPRSGQSFHEVLERDPKAKDAWERAKAMIQALAKEMKEKQWHWQEVSKAKPGPVCGKADWCAR